MKIKTTIDKINNALNKIREVGSVSTYENTGRRIHKIGLVCEDCNKIYTKE